MIKVQIKWLFLIGILFLTSCASYIPDEEMTIAQVAVDAAKEAKADIHDPVFFQRSQYYLKAAKRAYVDHEYEFAQTFANKARYFAEQAEEKAVVKQAQSSE